MAMFNRQADVPHVSMDVIGRYDELLTSDDRHDFGYLVLRDTQKVLMNHVNRYEDLYVNWKHRTSLNFDNEQRHHTMDIQTADEESNVETLSEYSSNLDQSIWNSRNSPVYKYITLVSFLRYSIYSSSDGCLSAQLDWDRHCY